MENIRDGRLKNPTELLPRLLPLFVTPGDAVSESLQVLLKRRTNRHTGLTSPSSLDRLTSSRQTVNVSTYLLIAYGAGSPVLVNLPSLELADGFVHGDFPDLHPLLQRYELSLSGRFHPSVGVVRRRRRLLRKLRWMGGKG